MIRFVMFFGLFCVLTIAPATAACAGADPAITSVAVQNMTTNGSMNVYHLKGRVLNIGRMKQASNVLQFVGIYEGDIRRDVRSVPPLKPGASFSFTYDYERGANAGTNTTDLVFRLYFRQPNPPGRQDCNLGNDRSTLQF